MLEITASGECVLIWGGGHTFGKGGFTNRGGGSLHLEHKCRGNRHSLYLSRSVRFASIDPPTSRLHNKPTTMSTRNKLRSANSIDESASNSTTISDTMEPTAKSDEFVSFVRSALKSINVKMDSVLSMLVRQTLRKN